MFKGQLIFLLLVWFEPSLQVRKLSEDAVYKHSGPIRQRLSEVRQLLVPLPEDQWNPLLHHLAKLLVPINAASDICRNHSQHLLHSFIDQEIWALRMVDASSKIQSGILDGNLQNLGNYAQCVNIEEPDKSFRGQHCVIETTGFLPPEISKKISRKPLPFIDADVMISLCVPSSCSDLDVITHVNQALAPIGVSAKNYQEELALSTDIKQISCSTPEGVPFRTKDYIAVFTYASVATLVLLGTLFRSRSGWLSCFSLSSNFRELMDTSPAADEVSCLNGLRVLMVLLPMAGHRSFTTLIMPTNRLVTIIEVYGSVTIAISEFFQSKAVDVFFLIGGCVLSYSFFLRNHKKKNFDVFDYCLKRYFRVTPLLAAVMLFHATLLVHTNHGPLWLRNIAEYEDKCYLNWWAGLLHISDLVVPHYLCVGESWYVACDFKLQCFAPTLLLLLLHKPRLGFFSITLCFSLSLAAVTFAAFHFELSTGYLVAILFGDRLTDLHIPLFYRGAVFRVSVFFMGLILGYIIFYFKRLKPSYSLCKRSAWIGWTLSVVTFSALTAVTLDVMSPDHEFHALLDPLYIAFSRPVFCACFAWIIFACHFGAGGCINEFLSWPGFRPLGRLVYSVSLVHCIVQAIEILSLEESITFSYTDEIFLYFGDVLTSFSVAVVMYLFVELPFHKLANRIINNFNRTSKLKKR